MFNKVKSYFGSAKVKKFSLLSYESQGWIVVIFGFFGFILWASLYPINQGIPGSGFLIPKTEKIAFLAPATT